jgi:N utilization substance protein A
MRGVKLSGTEIGCISTFQRLTKANAKDCIISDDGSIVFIVNKNDMGLAIGKKGANVKQSSKILKKDVSVVEYSENPVKFIKNVMYPIRTKTINIEDKAQKTVAKISVERRDRASAIGSKGKNINRVKKIVTRHHDIDDVVII